jgi:hypothetical protein
MKCRNIDGPRSIGSYSVVVLLEPETQEKEQKTDSGARQAQRPLLRCENWDLVASRGMVLREGECSSSYGCWVAFPLDANAPLKSPDGGVALLELGLPMT